jgi:hypothetical protein
MVLALAELIAAWNCRLQSEKSIVAVGRLADELAEVELAELGALVEVGGGVARLDEVQAALLSISTAAASTDRRVIRRLAGTS